MGKRYRCDYCDKMMVTSPSIIKTHNKGLLHQTLVQEHYQQYKNMETILLEESTKRPCLRYSTGNCKFGGMCRFSHYTKEQLQAMREQAQSKNQNQMYGQQPSFQDLYDQLQKEKTTQIESSVDDNTIIYDSHGVTYRLPWQYNPMFDVYGDNLPPSLRRLKLEDFVDSEINEWP